MTFHKCTVVATRLMAMSDIIQARANVVIAGRLPLRPFIVRLLTPRTSMVIAITSNRKAGMPMRIMMTSQKASTVLENIHAGRSQSPRPRPVIGYIQTLFMPFSQIWRR